MHHLSKEDQFIDYLERLFPVENRVIGIGDDCAVIPIGEGMVQLVTTDALVEGIHFLKEEISPRDLGYKCVAVNVSDIAAMGGLPESAFFTAAFPKTVDESWISQLVEGIKEACRRWNISLLGGDTVGSKRDLFFNITLIGRAAADRVKYRNRAEVGDIIAVTNYLGDSGGGLKALQEKVKGGADIEHLIHAHFHPEPSPDEGLWLSKEWGVHAMMDLSDGLKCDLGRLIRRSCKGAQIKIEEIPFSSSLLNVCSKRGWDALECALTGGEDYCLLLTLAPDAFQEVSQRFEKRFGHSLFPIGIITETPNEMIYLKNGKKLELSYLSFNHF